jgi:hypothetical protein
MLNGWFEVIIVIWTALGISLLVALSQYVLATGSP